MKIAIIGHGKMGREVERIALQRGHEIVCIVEKSNRAETLSSSAFKNATVAIEFTQPNMAVRNIIACFDAGVPVVTGTTGWDEEYEEVKKVCMQKNGALFHAHNFSIGVYLFKMTSNYIAKLMKHQSSYDVFMEEVHHIHKKDYPSGTAISLANGILEQISRLSGIAPYLQGVETPPTIADNRLPICCVREGEVPGKHTIVYDSEVDTITISHNAKGRAGFALGAVCAAEFLAGKRGIYNMDDLIAARPRL